MIQMETCAVAKCLAKERNASNTKLLCNCSLFNSEEDMKKSLTRLCYGNLYVAGSIWIQALQTALLGTRISLVQTVEAADKPNEESKKKTGDEKPGQKPKPMQLTELPLYSSPHAEYKTYEYEKGFCYGYNRKLWYEFLHPYVASTRKYTQETIKSYTTYIKETFNDVKQMANDAFTKVLRICRDDAYLVPRQIAVVTAGGLGFHLTTRKQPAYSKKLFVGCLAASLVGAMCLPTKTDETIRTIGFTFAKTAVAAYNLYEGTNYVMREPLPCLKSMPAMPPPRKTKCAEELEKIRAENEAFLAAIKKKKGIE